MVQLEPEASEASWVAGISEPQLDMPQLAQVLAWLFLVPVKPYHEALAAFPALFITKLVGFFSPLQ
jgi:hypothetical protein